MADAGWAGALGDLRPAAEPAEYEEIELVGGAEPLFACRHMPAGGARTAVVICPPTASDAEVNEHREVRLGRWLARAGIAAQRFHYRGTGHSEGDPAQVSFATLVDDTLRMVEHLHDRCGIDQVGFLGTRVGALVAARVARDRDRAPLALWQPVVDPRRYIDDSLAFASGRPRASTAAVWSGPGPGVTSGTSGPAVSPGVAGDAGLAGSPATIPWQLETPLGRDLFDPTVVDNLVDLTGVRPRPLLLVQLHRRVGLAPEYRAALGRWEARGFTVDLAFDPTEDDWWQVHPGWEPTDEVLSATASWLVEQLPGGPDDAGAGAGAGSGTGSGPWDGAP